MKQKNIDERLERLEKKLEDMSKTQPKWSFGKSISILLALERISELIVKILMDHG